jgi:Histidine kinase-like ATPase domain
MRATPKAAAEQLRGLRPMRASLARMVAAVRGVVGLAAAVSALLGAGGPVSLRWVVPAVAVLVGWTSVYVWTAWTRGLLAWLIGVDLLVAAMLCLAIGKLVPADAVTSTLSWVPNVASAAVVSAQLAGRPALSVPAGWLVAASIVTGTWLAGDGYGGLRNGLLLAVQDMAAAGVMVVAVRAERAAVAAFSDLEKTQEAAVLAAARREEERTLLRFVHNGPLTTLAMALQASAGSPSAVLQRRASAVLNALPGLAAAPADHASEVRLDGRLAQVLVWYDRQLAIAADMSACFVPSDVAVAFEGAMAEALENIVRHARTDRAAVELRDQGGAVVVTVSDQGRGFDHDQLPGVTFGLREDLTGRMASVGGAAVVLSAPGAGTVVRMEWHRG